jgi:hypothetical protein
MTKLTKIIKKRIDFVLFGNNSIRILLMVKMVSLAVTVAVMVGCAPAQAAPFNCNLPAFQRHGVLRNSCNAIAAAYDSVIVAQQNNSFQLGGHGNAALAALQSAYNEMLAAARTAN